MHRSAALLVVVVVALGAALFGVDGEPRATPRAAPAAQAPSSRPAALPEVPVAIEAPLTRAEREVAARAEEVRSSCGLALQTRCDGDRCVAVSLAPDLDQVSGWVDLLGDSPWFVASTAARDLGVPATWLPCGSAVASLAPGGTASVQRADGREVWCAAADDAGWDDERRALCDRAAVEVLGEGAGVFGGAGALRILTFGGEGS